MRLLKRSCLIMACAVGLLCFDLLGSAQRLVSIDQRFQKLDRGFVYISLQHESNPLTLPDQPQTLESFRQIYAALHNPTAYTYYEIYRQALQLSPGSGAFFDEGSGQLSECAEWAPTLQISENIQEDFGLAPQQGRRLSTVDFSHRHGQAVPVLLGHDYAQLYQVGQQFHANYLYNPHVFQVVGFLGEDCTIMLSTGSICLNRYIVMPSFQYTDAPKTEREYVGQKIHLANQTSGKIRTTPEQYDQVCRLVQSLLQTSTVGDYSWTSSSLARNHARYGIDIYLARTWLAVLAIVLWLGLGFLIVRYYGPRRRGQRLSQPFRRFLSLAASLTFATLAATFCAALIVRRWGLALPSFWGIGGGITLLVLGGASIAIALRPRDYRISG